MSETAPPYGDREVRRKLWIDVGVHAAVVGAVERIHDDDQYRALMRWIREDYAPRLGLPTAITRDALGQIEALRTAGEPFTQVEVFATTSVRNLS